MPSSGLKETLSSEERYRKIRQVLFLVLVLNFGVAGAKILYGWLIRSTSMTADGFHSFSDGTSNIIGLIGIWIASRPMDKSHPYGHKKYETLTSIGISILLFLVCLNVVREGINRFLYPTVPEVSRNSFMVMGITLAINYGVMVFEKRRGIALKSDILVSDAFHTRADILTSLSVIIALMGIRMGFPLLDPIVSFIIAGFIGYTGLNILKEGSRVLSDGVAIPLEEIKKVVLSMRGIKECHHIRSRGRPDDIHVDLHVLVDPEMHMHRAHHLSQAVENKIRREFPGVTDVVVHLEPFEKTEE